MFLFSDCKDTVFQWDMKILSHIFSIFIYFLSIFRHQYPLRTLKVYIMYAREGCKRKTKCGRQFHTN